MTTELFKYRNIVKRSLDVLGRSLIFEQCLYTNFHFHFNLFVKSKHHLGIWDPVVLHESLLKTSLSTVGKAIVTFEVAWFAQNVARTP